jgi:molybdopterin converting factor small subunit
MAAEQRLYRRHRGLLTSVRVRVLAFARVRELLAGSELTVELEDGARVGDAWAALARDFPALEEVETSTRVAKNGVVVSRDATLRDGDELALLPPVGGG